MCAGGPTDPRNSLDSLSPARQGAGSPGGGTSGGHRKGPGRLDGAGRHSRTFSRCSGRAGSRWRPGREAGARAEAEGGGLRVAAPPPPRCGPAHPRCCPAGAGTRARCPWPGTAWREGGGLPSPCPRCLGRAWAATRSLCLSLSRLFISLHRGVLRLSHLSPWPLSCALSPSPCLSLSLGLPLHLRPCPPVLSLSLSPGFLLSLGGRTPNAGRGPSSCPTHVGDRGSGRGR